MNSTSFTCFNNSKICDLYGPYGFYANMFNTEYGLLNKPLGRAKQSLRRSNQSLRRSEQSFRRSEQTLLRSEQTLLRFEQLKPDEAVIHHLIRK